MTNGMRSVRNKSAPLLSLVLGGLFLTALIACNLIANKFVSVDLGFKTFILSAGVLPYPITFLITDLLSELYGRKKTNQVVGIGFLCSAFVLLILWLGHLPFNTRIASIIGYLRSGLSKFVSRHPFLNDRLPLCPICRYPSVPLLEGFDQGPAPLAAEQLQHASLPTAGHQLGHSCAFLRKKNTIEMTDMVRDGWLFKALCAMLDTAFLYLIVFTVRRHFGAQPLEDLQLTS